MRFSAGRSYEILRRSIVAALIVSAALSVWFLPLIWAPAIGSVFLLFAIGLGALIHVAFTPKDFRRPCSEIV